MGETGRELNWTQLTVNRRLARRGGVKRISAQIYPSTREALKKYLQKVIEDTVIIMDHCQRKTVTVTDVRFLLFPAQS